MAQQSRALVLAEDAGSGPSTHMETHTIFNSNSSPLLDSVGTRHTYTCGTHIHMQARNKLVKYPIHSS